MSIAHSSYYVFLFATVRRQLSAPLIQTRSDLVLVIWYYMNWCLGHHSGNVNSGLLLIVLRRILTAAPDVVDGRLRNDVSAAVYPLVCAAILPVVAKV